MSRRTKPPAHGAGSVARESSGSFEKPSGAVSRSAGGPDEAARQGSRPFLCGSAGSLLITASRLGLRRRSRTAVTARAEAPPPCPREGSEERRSRHRRPRRQHAATGAPLAAEARRPRRDASRGPRSPSRSSASCSTRATGRPGGHHVRVGASEPEITLDRALRLRRLLLQDASFEVFLTREADATMSLERRVAFANAGARTLRVDPRQLDFASRRSPVETYHVGPDRRSRRPEAGRAENRESGYSLGDYRQLLEKIYIDVRRGESRRSRQRSETELYRALSAVDPGLANRGVKMAPFPVLVGTEMPAILVEVSCLSNEEEAQLLTTEDYRAADRRGPARGHPILLEAARWRRQEGGMNAMEENETLCVGIDLGTSRSSVSASNGERHVVDSYVGWPVDMVARKVVQKPVLIGREALDNRSMLDLHRPLERGVIQRGVGEATRRRCTSCSNHLLGLVGLKRNGKQWAQVRAVVGVPAADLSREQAAPAGRPGRHRR